MAWAGKRKSAIRDALSVAFFPAIVVIVADPVDSFGVIAGWPRQHEVWHVGVLLSANLPLAFALAVFVRGRSVELPGCLAERRRAEEALRARE